MIILSTHLLIHDVRPCGLGLSAFSLEDKNITHTIAAILNSSGFLPAEILAICGSVTVFNGTSGIGMTTAWSFSPGPADLCLFDSPNTGCNSSSSALNLLSWLSGRPSKRHLESGGTSY